MTLPQPLVFQGYLPGGVPLVPPPPINDGVFNSEDHGLVTTGALAVNFSEVRVHYATLGAPNTVLTVGTTIAAGKLQTGVLWLTQDAAGVRMVSFPANIRWQGGFSPSLSTGPGATDVLQMMSNDGGATWLAAISMQVAPQS